MWSCPLMRVSVSGELTVAVVVVVVVFLWS